MLIKRSNYGSICCIYDCKHNYNTRFLIMRNDTQKWSKIDMWNKNDFIFVYHSNQLKNKIVQIYCISCVVSRYIRFILLMLTQSSAMKYF